MAYGTASISDQHGSSRHLSAEQSFGPAVVPFRIVFDPGRLGHDHSVRRQRRPEKAIAMGPAGSARPFFYRMPPGQFHSLAIDSELLVFVESNVGPFRANESENASWAPPPKDAISGRAYVAPVLRESAEPGYTLVNSEWSADPMQRRSTPASIHSEVVGGLPPLLCGRCTDSR
jgi:hypothetical protein